MAASRAQRLLRRPQGVAPALGPHDQQVREIDAAGRQGGRVGYVRRRNPDDALTGAREAGERRQNERELTDARLVRQDFGQCLRGPAAARDLRIERGEAAWQRLGALGSRAPAPDRMPLKDLFEGAHTVFSYSNGQVTSA